MKTLVFLLFSSLFINLNTFSQNCNAPQNLLNSYKKDVSHLTLIRLELFNAPYIDSVNIPQSWQDTIWKGLAAIYNSQSTERSQVFDQYCIHHQSNTTTNYLRISNRLYVSLDTSASWQQNWDNNIITTGDNYLDSLFNKYNIDSVYNFLPSANIYKLYTNDILNLDALAAQIAAHNKVNYAEKVIDQGDGMQIIYSKNNEVGYFDFSIGWGDCLSGCVYRQTWHFSVDPTCNATFIGIDSVSNPSTPMPQPLNCNLTYLPDSFVDQVELNIYPNPFSDILHINLQSYSKVNYFLYDISGRIIKSGNLTNYQINQLNEFNPGIYFLTLISGDKIITKRIIKE